jgi:hypothetical protein
MNKTSLKIVIIVTLAALVVFSSITASRIGKFKVDIITAPSTATVRVDDKKTSHTTVYLSRGKHKFSAELNGFSSDSKTLDIEKNTSVKLLLDPQTDAAKQLLEDNPQLQLEREHIGSTTFTQNSKQISEKYPYLSQLPISGVRFSVNYGLAQRTKKTPDEAAIALYITATDAGERRNALSNIAQELSIDPSSVEIIFDDYVNPFAQEVSSE